MGVVIILLRLLLARALIKITFQPQKVSGPTGGSCSLMLSWFPSMPYLEVLFSAFRCCIFDVQILRCAHGDRPSRTRNFAREMAFKAPRWYLRLKIGQVTAASPIMSLLDGPCSYSKIPPSHHFPRLSVWFEARKCPRSPSTTHLSLCGRGTETIETYCMLYLSSLAFPCRLSKQAMALSEDHAPR